MLSFHMTNSAKAIQIDCDEEGMGILLDALARVRTYGGHVHLCTPANGGHELSETTPFGQNPLGEVIITYVHE